MLKAPEALLNDENGKPFGKHFAGPSWEANDGSRVTGKAAASVPSPDSEAIPWLLVSVVRRSGEGVLARVTSIQHVNTKGGKALHPVVMPQTSGRSGTNTIPPTIYSSHRNKSNPYWPAPEENTRFHVR